jgi:hypothetical protein
MSQFPAIDRLMRNIDEGADNEDLLVESFILSIYHSCIGQNSEDHVVWKLQGGDFKSFFEFDDHTGMYLNGIDHPMVPSEIVWHQHALVLRWTAGNDEWGRYDRDVKFGPAVVSFELDWEKLESKPDAPVAFWQDVEFAPKPLVRWQSDQCMTNPWLKFLMT